MHALLIKLSTNAETAAKAKATTKSEQDKRKGADQEQNREYHVRPKWCNTAMLKFILLWWAVSPDLTRISYNFYKE